MIGVATIHVVTSQSGISGSVVTSPPSLLAGNDGLALIVGEFAELGAPYARPLREQFFSPHHLGVEAGARADPEAQRDDRLVAAPKDPDFHRPCVAADPEPTELRTGRDY